MKRLLFALAAGIVLPAAAFAQDTTTVTGTITDLNNHPLPYAIVHVDGTYTAAQSDMNGNFVLHNVSANYCLTAQLIGYEMQRRCFSLPSDKHVTLTMTQAAYVKNEVIVTSTRAGENSGIAYTDVSRSDIEQQNFGQDLPYLLSLQPSVVTTSDAGTGIGYTGIRIRGSDNTRVNVTINGIPVNDAESQGTYWVDIPDIASSTQNIQVQRGVGTSTNGAGAFGGSVNVLTDDERLQPYAALTTTGGSFNTYRISAKAGTGLLNNHWSFNTRLSKTSSDGYIDRGSSDLSSWYFSGGYSGKKLSVKAITFSGREKTYQCWYGVPQDSLATHRTYNPAGEYYDASGNVHYYDNETDNYQQDYYQLHFLYRANDRWNFNAALHATKGKGYYEEYRPGELLSDYGLDTGAATGDLVRRLWLDNWFYGVTYGATYDSHKRVQLVIGGAANNYEGQHYDEVIWGTNLPAGTEPVHRYDNDYAHKFDFNIFSRLNYQLSEKLNAAIDLQYRRVDYGFNGLDTMGNVLPQSVALNFFNPKAALTLRTGDRSFAYASFAVGNKEPNRDDFKNSSVNSRPKQETLYDGEAGWKFRSEKFAAEANVYYMYYRNQLVLTGRVNDVGAYTRENVDQSFRRGIELAAGWQIIKPLNFSANVTLSQNKIMNFHEFIDDYDNGGQVENVYNSPDIAFSPAMTGAGVLTWKSAGFLASFTGKYVGKQYLDNTMNETRKIDPYFVCNLQLAYTVIPPEKYYSTRGPAFDELTFSVQVNNLFNTMYVSNGYTYGYYYGGQYNLYNYYYPQAGTNFMGMLSMKFGSHRVKRLTVPFE